MNLVQRLHLLFKQHCKYPILMEFLVITAIISVTVAILLPSEKWAADGDIIVPVRVMIFDAKPQLSG